MNIQMQVGGIFILLLLLYFYKRQGTLGLYSGKIFLRALYVTLLCLALDILSIVMIVNQDKFPPVLIELECKSYLATLVINGYMTMIYTNSDVNHLAKADRFVHVMTVIGAVIVSSIYLLPIRIFYDGGSIVYTYGPACYATYAGALVAVFITFFMLFTKGKSMNPKRRRAIQLWLTIWIIAAITQFLDSRLLLVGFASAMGIVIQFFELENPEIFIDRYTGFYNFMALTEFLTQKFRLKKNFYGFVISMEETQIKNIPMEKLESVMYNGLVVKTKFLTFFNEPIQMVW